MSKPAVAEPVKLAVSVLYTDDSLLMDVLKKLSDQYGCVDFVSQVMSFNYTRYYEKEMGDVLKRRFVFFEKSMRPESLPDVKLFCNRIEEKSSLGGMRRVNIDPGYISKAHLILATGKGYTHRPYLRDGIYADLTLMYKNRGFCVLQWTYPDYAEKKIIEMFNKIREKYVQQFRHEGRLAATVVQ